PVLSARLERLLQRPPGLVCFPNPQVDRSEGVQQPGAHHRLAPVIRPQGGRHSIQPLDHLQSKIVQRRFRVEPLEQRLQHPPPPPRRWGPPPAPLPPRAPRRPPFVAPCPLATAPRAALLRRRSPPSPATERAKIARAPPAAAHPTGP